MNYRIRTVLLAAAAMTAFAAPAVADIAVCTVKAPAIRLRKSPNKNASIVAVLKKDARVTTGGACAGGWVKVTSEDGRLDGYVAGWAITDTAAEIAAGTITPAKPEVVNAEPAPSAATQLAVPSNEKLAIQITDLRLNVLGIERDMARMNKEIQNIKTAIRRKATTKKVANGKNRRANQSKKG